MRLTKFDGHDYYVPRKNFVLDITIDDFCQGNVIDKLGQVEDIEEKHNVISVDDLDKRLTALEIIENKNVAITMVDKIVSWWFAVVVIQLSLVLTFGILIGSIIISYISKNALWLLLNISYLFVTPFLILMWKYVIKLIKENRGIL